MAISMLTGAHAHGFDDTMIQLPREFITRNGTDGKDRLIGDDGSDTLRGLGGNDLIDGDDGDDVLVGGAGDDRIIGDNGADRIVFDADRGQEPQNFGDLTLTDTADGLLIGYGDSTLLLTGLTSADISASQFRFD